MIKLTGIRLPTAAERKRGAEIVFKYLDHSGRRETIFAATCYESWQQWGAARDVLSTNCDTVEAWRRGELAEFPYVDPDVKFVGEFTPKGIPQ